MPSRIMIVDASPLIYRVWSTQGHLATSDGMFTGLRYGFLRSIRSYQQRTKCDQVAIAFDVKGPIVKAQSNQNYKSNREFTEDKATMYSQVPDLRAMLELTKWTMLSAPGYEADDIIGALVRAKEPRGHDCVIVTSDNDMCQLVSSKTKIFRPASSRDKTNKDLMIDERWVQDTYGVPPQNLLCWRALVGDRSDNLTGSLHEKHGDAEIVRKALNELTVPLTIDTLTPFIESLPISLTDDQHAKLVENFCIMSLVTPPNMEVVKGRKDPVAMKQLFERLQFKSMMKFIPELTGTEDVECSVT